MFQKWDARLIRVKVCVIFAIIPSASRDTGIISEFFYQPSYRLLRAIIPNVPLICFEIYLRAILRSYLSILVSVTPQINGLAHNITKKIQSITFEPLTVSEKETQNGTAAKPPTYTKTKTSGL